MQAIYQQRKVTHSTQLAYIKPKGGVSKTKDGKPKKVKKSAKYLS
jgi:hypothetical protein